MTGWEVDPARLLDESAARSAGAGGSLARTLLGALNPDGSQPVVVRQGSVVSFSPTTWQATVTVSGDTTQVPGVPHLQDYLLQAGDPVWLVKYGPGYMVLGSPTAAKRGSDNAYGVVISRYMGTATRLTSPGIGAFLSVHYASNVVTIPTNARLVNVSADWGGHASANAACDWYGRLRFGPDTGSFTDLTVMSCTKHNEGNPALNIGAGYTARVDVTAHRGKVMGIYTDCANSPYSGAGIHPGWMNWTITFET